MEPVLAAPWKIILPAILCLAETALTGPIITERTTAEMKASPSASTRGDEHVVMVHTTLPFVIDVDVAYTVTHISQGYTVKVTVNVTALEESTFVTVGGSATINVRVIAMDTAGTAGNTTGGSELKGPILGNVSATRPTTPDVSSSVEGTSENISPNVSDAAASTNTPSAPYTSALVPESVATIQNEAGLHDTRSDISLLELHSPGQEDFASTENPENLTLPSTENMTGTNAVRTITPRPVETTTTVQPINVTPTLRSSTGSMEENTACYPNCAAFPGWATVLLCLTTSFFIFMLVGFLFLFPYWTKVAHPTAVPCGSPPRNST